MFKYVKKGQFFGKDDHARVSASYGRIYMNERAYALAGSPEMVSLQYDVEGKSIAIITANDNEETFKVTRVKNGGAQLCCKYFLIWFLNEQLGFPADCTVRFDVSPDREGICCVVKASVPRRNRKSK